MEIMGGQPVGRPRRPILYSDHAMNGRTRATPAPLVLLLAALSPAQVPHREVPRPQEFTQSQDDNLFSLPRSQEDIHAWEQSLQDLAEGRNEVAVERLHRLVQ